MSKKHEREQRVLERLQEENKILKQANRRLQKQVKELGRGYYKFMVAQDEEQEKEAVHEARETAKKICYDCGTGEYKEIIVAKRRWRQCAECGKRGKVTILEN